MSKSGRLTVFSFLAAIALLVGACSSGSSGDIGTVIEDDLAPPEPGSGITFSDVGHAAMSVSWGAAADDRTAEALLEYKLVRSASGNISTVDDAEANGTTVMNWTADTLTAGASGLDPSTLYHFAVLVRDESGNKAVYPAQSQSTGAAPDTEPPVPGAGISVVGGSTSVFVSWGAAADDETAEAGLSYKLLRSEADNLGSVEDAEANGTTVADWTADTLSAMATGLSLSTDYYFAVLVKDAAGNKAVYPCQGVTTEAFGGVFDESFGGAGIVTTDLASDQTAYATAVQSDGKIVIAGLGRAPEYRFAVARYNADGSPDTGFGTDGVVTTLIGDESYAQAVAIQSDGKIVAAGQSRTGDDYRMTLARYDTDGSLDTAFNGTGIVTADFGYTHAYASSVAIRQTDGKIVIGGRVNDGSDHFLLARYDTDGSIDTTFNGTGTVVDEFAPGVASSVTSLVIQPSDDKIVAAGTAGSDFALARCQWDGSLDTDFNGTGMATTTPVAGYGDNVASAVSLQPDGRILVAGYWWDIMGSGDFVLVRYETDGTLDEAFGTDGIVITSFEGDDNAYSMALQADGRIVVAGQTHDGVNTGFALVRYETDGSLDATFGTGGKMTPAVGTIASAKAVAVQADGRIVVAGSVQELAGNADFVVIRCLP